MRRPVSLEKITVSSQSGVVQIFCQLVKHCGSCVPNHGIMSLLEYSFCSPVALAPVAFIKSGCVCSPA